MNFTLFHFWFPSHRPAEWLAIPRQAQVEREKCVFANQSASGCWLLLRDIQLLWSIADCLSHPQFNKRIHTQKQSSQYVDFNIVRLFSFLSMRALSVFSLHQAFSGFITTQKCMCLQTSRRDPC